MDSTCRTLILALAAKTALRVVDIRQVVLNCNRVKLAHFLALAASDTCVGTSFACHSTLVLVHAHHYDATTLRTFLTELDDVAWASLHTLAAAGTLLVVHLW